MIGKTISHYKILEKLGAGGMGVVYRAQDTKLDRHVALKFLPQHLSQAEEEKKRFIHEAKAASALDHPNIGTIHEIDVTEDGQMFIAMACYEGESLKERIDHGPLPIDEVIDIAIQITQGLEKAHSKEIVHRDIKPANILLTDDGQVKIVDFGLAKLAGRTMLTKEGTTLGTVAYMSPEQARGEQTDRRTDIWALGVVLYEMLIGRLPFDAEYDQAVLYSICHEAPEAISDLRSDVPEKLAQVIHRALEKDPQVRYPSCTDLLADLRTLRSEGVSQAHLPLTKQLRQPRFAIPLAAIVLALVATVGFWIKRNADADWARQELLPQIEQLAKDVNYMGEGPSSWEAYKLALQAEQHIPDDPLLNRLFSQISRYMKIYTKPTEAKLYFKPYADPDSAWEYVGTTPADSFRLPIGFYRIKIERQGFETVEDIAWVNLYTSDTLRYTLSESRTLPKEMVLLPDNSNWYDLYPAPANIHLPGLEQVESEEIGDFLMDRYEVTNKDYKRFVDGGGYKKPEFWKQPFVKDGRTLSWDEAMALFHDKTGRPGPATWEVGDYPDGQDDFPVTGVSWYEAAAYAEFVGKSLPTIYHWDRAALAYASPEIVRLSNLRGNEGPVPVGHSQSMNRFGVHDLSGNVREWCFNEASRVGRFLMGGSWNDPSYAFTDIYGRPAFDRSEMNGFRCIQYLGESANNRPNLEKLITLAFRDFSIEKPVSDEIFKLFLNQFAYDKTELNAVIERKQEQEDWILEIVSFDAAYGNERMSAFVFLPRSGTPPFQTVVYFPASIAIHTPSSKALPVNMELASCQMFPKTGRAFVYPIYKSTYERKDELKTDYSDETIFYKEHVIMWVKDLSQTIDYLETRDDIDAGKLAFYGFSWGGYLGAILTAVEKRFNASVLNVAGLYFQRALPEVEPLH
ncbi:MAG: protein kinase [bacterium]